MEGLMQDYELSLQHVLWRIERLHQKREVVTKRDEGVHRTTYGEMVPRINRLAGALKRLGVKPGDRVATLAWNNNRHLELYYAVPCMGAVLHTLNLRLFPHHLEFIINDAEDKVLFVDQSLLPLLKPLLGKIPSIKTMVLMAEGNPPDGPQLAPAVHRVAARTGRPPRAATADRGYGEATVERDLHDAGVSTVAIPRKGKPSQTRQREERKPAFRKLVKWRTGSEGRISHLKHRYQWDRSRVDGQARTATWCGYGILTHNLVKITNLAATQPA